MTDYISRADAIEAVKEIFTKDGCIYKNLSDINTHGHIVEALKALPSADAVDCTDFIEWLVDRVLDETIWEYNSVAYGEIICRKLEKLGLLETKDGYYIRHIENNTKPSDLVYRPSADAVSREEYKETDGVVTIEKQNANEVGEIKHIVVCSPNYTRYFYNDSMPTQYKGGDDE